MAGRRLRPLRRRGPRLPVTDAPTRMRSTVGCQCAWTEADYGGHVCGGLRADIIMIWVKLFLLI